MKQLFPLVAATAALLASCDRSASLPDTAEDPGEVVDRFDATDVIQKKISENLATYETIATIDHSRLAADEGVTMPPSVVTIFGDPSINTQLIKLNPRVGLDLPQKVLVYEEAGEEVVTYADSNFLFRRHGHTNKLYDAPFEKAFRGVSERIVSPVDSGKITKDYGIIELVSDFSLEESCRRIKAAVMDQGDAVWFGEIDFQAEAASQGEAIAGATLLLFGAPEPGGVAMAQFPKLGLDAFCQKILVYEDADGVVRVIYNDIVAFAELHYGTSIKPHRVINGRLKQTFEGAIRSR